MATKFLKGPERAWDTLFETLHMDADSSMLDAALRRDIQNALNKVEYIEPPVSTKLKTVLVVNEKQKRWLLEFLGVDAKWFRDNDRPPGENYPQQLIDQLTGGGK